MRMDFDIWKRTFEKFLVLWQFCCQILPNILDQFKTWVDRFFENATFLSNFFAKQDSDPHLFELELN